MASASAYTICHRSVLLFGPEVAAACLGPAGLMMVISVAAKESCKSPIPRLTGRFQTADRRASQPIICPAAVATPDAKRRRSTCLADLAAETQTPPRRQRHNYRPPLRKRCLFSRSRAGRPAQHRLRARERLGVAPAAVSFAAEVLMFQLGGALRPADLASRPTESGANRLIIVFGQSSIYLNAAAAAAAAADLHREPSIM